MLIFNQLECPSWVGGDEDDHVHHERVEPLLKRIDNWFFPSNHGDWGTHGAWGQVVQAELDFRGLGLILIVWQKQGKVNVLTPEYLVLQAFIYWPRETQRRSHARSEWAWSCCGRCSERGECRVYRLSHDRFDRRTLDGTEAGVLLETWYSWDVRFVIGLQHLLDRGQGGSVRQGAVFLLVFEA